MKALKVWTWIVALLGIGCYIGGFVSGEFHHGYGLLAYGTSDIAIALLLFCLFCLLLAVSLVFVIHAIASQSHKDPQ